MPADKTANIFVPGLDEQNLDTLNRLPERERYAFHGLLTIPELQQGEIPIVELLTKAEQSLDEFDGTVDAVVGYWDFPVSTMLPLLCRSRGLPSASLEAVLKCEHKYWSRLEQRKGITEYPAFAVIDPDDDDPKPPADLRYPIWLKPVKSFSSELAFKVHDDAEFAEAMRQLEDGIGRVGDPFQFILDQADLPDEVAQVGARAVLAEESMSGVQAAVEGYARNGDVVVYGALDSVNFPDTDSFLRHQYPSQLPERAVDRMADVAKRVIEHIGLDNLVFSVEFFVDPETDDVWLLEINPRHSQSHAELFAHVDGVANHELMVLLGLGEEPLLPDGGGRYAVAAKWFHRHFDGDAIVRRTPTRDEIDRIERELDGVEVEIVVDEGDQLSTLEGQDSYSCELAQFIIGGDSVDDMTAKYRAAVDALHFELEPVRG